MWNTLTNAELRSTINRIVLSSSNADEVNRRAKDELDYPYRIAVSYSKPNAAGQRMSMFMATSRNGKTLT